MENEQGSSGRKSLLNQAFFVCVFFVVITPSISRILLHTSGNKFTVSFQFFLLFIALLIQTYLGKIRKLVLIFAAIFAMAVIFFLTTYK